MTRTSWRLLYWSPRVLTIAFIAFVSMFALDVFTEGRGFRETLLALAMHLIPSFVLIGALLLAWRWEWVGATVFAFAGALHLLLVLRTPLPWATKLAQMAPIEGTAFLIAGLWLANWIKREEPGARG
jgi:hypothetical protein